MNAGERPKPLPEYQTTVHKLCSSFDPPSPEYVLDHRQVINAEGSELADEHGLILVCLWALDHGDDEDEQLLQMPIEEAFDELPETVFEKLRASKVVTVADLLECSDRDLSEAQLTERQIQSVRYALHDHDLDLKDE